MRDFAAPELDDGLDPVAFLQKTNGVVLLEIGVVVVGVGTELELLDLHHVLLLSGVVLLLLLLVLVVAEIHGLRHRRHSRWRHQDQVQAQLLRFAQGRRGGHDFRGSVRKNGPHFTRPDGLVHVLSTILPAGRKVSAWIHLDYALALGWRKGWMPGLILRPRIEMVRVGGKRKLRQIQVYTKTLGGSQSQKP